MKKLHSYRRLTWTDRLRIDALYNAGHTYRFIAQQLGKSVSSIHTEIQHGLYPHLGAETTKRPYHYSAKIAQDYADSQATIKGVSIALDHHYDFVEYVSIQISKGYSPEHITSSLSRSGMWTVSTSTLYRYIDRGYIPNVSNKQLLEKSRRRRRISRVRPAARPPKGFSIESRPSFVDDRLCFGHWEIDSVVGKAQGSRQSVLVLTERMTRYELIIRVASKSSAATVRALASTLSKYPKGTFKTLTCDNGCEFADCYGMTHDSHGNRRTTVYYCHPYCSSERGSNERANRIVRRFFPKGKSMFPVTQKQCDAAAAFINSMRRRILGYDTAQERFDQQLALLAKSVC